MTYAFLPADPLDSVRVSLSAVDPLTNLTHSAAWDLVPVSTVTHPVFLASSAGAMGHAVIRISADGKDLPGIPLSLVGPRPERAVRSAKSGERVELPVGEYSIGPAIPMPHEELIDAARIVVLEEQEASVSIALPGTLGEALVELRLPPGEETLDAKTVFFAFLPEDRLGTSITLARRAPDARTAHAWLSRGRFNAA